MLSTAPATSGIGTAAAIVIFSTSAATSPSRIAPAALRVIMAIAQLALVIVPEAVSAAVLEVVMAADCPYMLLVMCWLSLTVGEANDPPQVIAPPVLVLISPARASSEACARVPDVIDGAVLVPDVGVGVWSVALAVSTPE